MTSSKISKMPQGYSNNVSVVGFEPATEIRRIVEEYHNQELILADLRQQEEMTDNIIAQMKDIPLWRIKLGLSIYQSKIKKECKPIHPNYFVNTVLKLHKSAKPHPKVETYEIIQLGRSI